MFSTFIKYKCNIRKALNHSMYIEKHSRKVWKLPEGNLCLHKHSTTNTYLLYNIFLISKNSRRWCGHLFDAVFSVYLFVYSFTIRILSVEYKNHILVKFLNASISLCRRLWLSLPVAFCSLQTIFIIYLQTIGRVLRCSCLIVTQLLYLILGMYLTRQ